jgi:hypothetical protein
VLHTRDVATSGAGPLLTLAQQGVAGAGAVQQPSAQHGADPGGNGDGDPASAAATVAAEPTNTDTQTAAVLTDQQADLRAEEVSQQQTEEQANSTCKQS